MGRPTIIGVPHGLDIATMTVKIMSSLISYHAASLTDEVFRPLSLGSHTSQNAQPLSYSYSITSGAGKTGKQVAEAFAD